MSKIRRFSSLLLFSSLFSSLSFLFIPGLANSPSNGNEAASKKTSSASSTGLKIAMILVGLLGVGAFCVFLYKLWQRKKRDEQHARLLKLFEQDDDLEAELGFHD